MDGDYTLEFNLEELEFLYKACVEYFKNHEIPESRRFFNDVYRNSIEKLKTKIIEEKHPEWFENVRNEVMNKNATTKVLLEIEVDIEKYLDCEDATDSFEQLAETTEKWAKLNRTKWIKDAQTKEIKVKQDWKIVWTK